MRKVQLIFTCGNNPCPSLGERLKIGVGGILIYFDVFVFCKLFGIDLLAFLACASLIAKLNICAHMDNHRLMQKEQFTDDT